MNLEPGNIVDSRYRIIVQIGSSSGGQIYKAFDQLLNVEVAVKFFSRVKATDDAAVLQFTNEAKALSQLTHPNIIRVFRSGFHNDSTPFLVEELLPGQSLRKVLGKRGRLRCNEAVAIALKLASALEYSQANQILHLNLRPENVFLVGGDTSAAKAELKLLDFGLSQIAQGDTDIESTLAGADMQSTMGGAVFEGSVPYLSPEQIRNETVDGRSDIYSFACMFFEMLVGKPPYRGTAAEVMQMHLNKRVPRLLELSPACGLPEALDDLIQKSTATAKEDRYKSFKELGEVLERINELDSAAEFTAAAKDQGKRKSGQWLSVAAATIAALACAVFLLVNSEFFFEWKIRQELADPRDATERLCGHLQSDLTNKNFLDARRIEEIVAEPTPILSDEAKEELYLRFFELYRSAGLCAEATDAAIRVLESALLRNMHRKAEAAEPDIQRSDEACKYLLEQNLNKQQFSRLNHVFSRCWPAFYGPNNLLYRPILLAIKTYDNYLNGEAGRAQTTLFVYQISAEHASALNDAALMKELIKRIDRLHSKYGQCKYYFLAHIAEGNFFLNNNDRASAINQMDLLRTELAKKLVFSGAEMEAYHMLEERLRR